MNLTASAILAVLAFGFAQQVTKQDVPGITNFARLETTGDGRTLLKKGRDAKKDQSYFLFSLRQEQLAFALHAKR